MKTVTEHRRLLGVRKRASKKEIRTAYLRAALEHHPDKTAFATGETFISCKRAYDALMEKNIDETCKECTDRNLLIQKFMEKLEKLAKATFPILSFDDFRSSIFYRSCYDKVIQNDRNRYGDGDITKFPQLNIWRNL